MLIRLKEETRDYFINPAHVAAVYDVGHAYCRAVEVVLAGGNKITFKSYSAGEIMDIIALTEKKQATRRRK
jgi:hypothetical protein